MQKLMGRACFILLAFTTVVRPAFCQTTFGSIEGTIGDSSHAAIPGAAVNIVNPDMGISRATITDQRGFYRVANLTPATYRVTVTAKGFATEVQDGVRLDINQTGVINLTLQPSTVEQTINVDSTVTGVNTVTSEVGSTIGTKQVNDLPLNGRSFDQLIGLLAVETDLVPALEPFPVPFEHRVIAVGSSIVVCVVDLIILHLIRRSGAVEGSAHAGQAICPGDILMTSGAGCGVDVGGLGRPVQRMGKIKRGGSGGERHCGQQRKNALAPHRTVESS